MPSKPARSISEQIALLKSRNMLFNDEQEAEHFLRNISYYRLKGYWWDMQLDKTTHALKPNTYFEDIIERYNFDRHLRLILFDAIERIEVALRTKMINHLSMSYGGLWYKDASLFDANTVTYKNNNVEVTKTNHQFALEELQKEFKRSKEIFIKDHQNRYPNQDADAWKTLEVASMGTLSKLYKNLNHQLPEKALIAQGMGLNLSSELSSWLEAMAYVRNITAHHSRLWSRNMVKRPALNINNPQNDWFLQPFINSNIYNKKPFLIISAMIYICNKVTPNHQVKSKIIELINDNPKIPIYKLGFFNDWDKQPLWK